MSQTGKKGFAALYDLQERKNTSSKPADPPQPTPTPSIPIQPQPPPSIAPARDFNRRANSIERDALPAGLFPGSSKKLYDALYLRTRGANPPRASVKATKRDLMDWSGVRNVKTVDTHMRYMVGVGLVTKIGENGDREGFAYEVRLPEQLTPTNSNQPQPTPSMSLHDRKMEVEGVQKMEVVGVGQTVEAQPDSLIGKTLLKTNTEKDDDEAFARLLARLRQASQEITGKEPSAADAERWEQLAELLIAELKIAAGRTTVSSVPAFLTEHLRRRLWKREKPQLEEEGKSGIQSLQVKVDSSKCQDCFGTGMWYPEGFEKGVAKCGHEKLAEGA